MKIILTCLTLLSVGLNTIFAQNASNKTTLPLIVPTPTSVELGHKTISLGKEVVLIEGSGTTTEATQLVRNILKTAGVETITTASRLPRSFELPHLVLGISNDKLIEAALKQSNAKQDKNPEGYSLSSITIDNGALITIAGNDDAGLFYGAQTLSQIIKDQAIPAITIQDHPAMPIRGTIEGFYGKPWTMEGRAKHLEFLGTVKANTYVYSPKDDPYARDKWREAYPKDILDQLASLVSTAQRNQINFVYAISPGPTICFSDPNDLQLLEDKFKVLRTIGIHNFYVALDDIEYKQWNCDKDEKTYGPSGTKAAGLAQAELLNKLQANLDKLDPEAQPLITVPTEYYDAKESDYKKALTENLDPRIIIQWTGTDVVPPAISVGDAKQATKAFGRKTLLWDNYPVNDYAQTTGRLLLAPYNKREAGLSEQLSGILSNPMNQEAASRVAVIGIAAFGWNDTSYDPELTWYYAARYLANKDPQATEALLTFFDTQHIAPTFGSQPWQKQAPDLKKKLNKVRYEIAFGSATSRNQAIEKLKEQASKFATAPNIIQSQVVDADFITESAPWLEAMQLWGRALQLTAAGLGAANQGSISAKQYFNQAQKLANEASEVQSIPGATRFDGPIKIADGVLDNFINDAPKLIAIDSGK
ncbi:beta-N-acetylglucosaminidase domain-containing protein [Fulvivirga maritima]|uniref:beta-N-acetylhexosaminidase family protein n=1 Tax=Fulvivirga maritima TaxID=2904247 RepID=UPI001F28D1D9|nr:beta-N-acetylglucosaminidase domain-containing protein [Fulvivirga maritima]UII28952.1 beta-N-acetylglucosaminidase domain-containing protein [Fulvivirga maritima]